MSGRGLFDLKALKRAYRTAPRFVHFLLSPVHTIYCFLKEIYETIYVDAWLLRGKEVQGGEPLVIFFNGHSRQKCYLVRMVFGGACEEVHFGKIWVWQAPGIVRRHAGELDLVIYDTHAGISSWLGDRRCLCMPTWVDGYMDFALIDFTSNQIKSDIKRIRKNGYTFEVTKDKIMLERFFKDVYLPYTIERYAGERIPQHYENLIRETNQIELLQIKKDGACVAGEVLCYKDGNVLMKCVGVKPGSEALVKAGVLQAIYYFKFIYLKDKAHKKIVLGGSRTFFRDGVLAFKKKWGLYITNRGFSVMRLYPFRESRGLRSFLMHNPFVALDGKDLVGMVFADQVGELTNKDIQVIARYRWPGLKRVVVYRLGGDSTPAEQRACADNGIELRSARTLFGKSGEV